MTQILADAEMAKQLAAATGPVEVVNDQGAVIAVCTPVRGRRSPYPREEIERIRQKYRETGKAKSLSEILKQLQELGGTPP